MELRKIVVGVLTYDITEDGNIVKRKGKGFYKTFPDKDGYLKLASPQNGKTVNAIVHRLVYEVFVGPIPPGWTVDHIDNNRQNNHYSNLQVMAAKDNAIKGNAKSWKAISPEGEVVEIYNLKKFCRDNGLHQGHLHVVLNGKNPKYLSHKGWRKYYE